MGLVGIDPSKTCFDLAFREHRPALLRFLRRRLGNEADADEVAQEAYLRLLRYSGQPDPGVQKALLYRIAINLAGMRARQAASHHSAAHQSLDELPLESAAAAHDQQLIDQERLNLLMSAIQSLPDKCRQVFVLSRFHDLSYAEIALRCGISVKMVEKHISKALAVCRLRVGDRLQ
jgi:RNA polymerase sigma factor (sigma-70 family)